MMQLTGLVLQCTDVGWGRPHHCAVPPTSPQTLGDREAERPPSWRTTPWECVPRNQTWRWPRSVQPLKTQQAKKQDVSVCFSLRCETLRHAELQSGNKAWIHQTQNTRFKLFNCCLNNYWTTDWLNDKLYCWNMPYGYKQNKTRF